VGVGARDAATKGRRRTRLVVGICILSAKEGEDLLGLTECGSSGLYT
jgi:hypothetical protein